MNLKDGEDIKGKLEESKEDSRGKKIGRREREREREPPGSQPL